MIASTEIALPCLHVAGVIEELEDIIKTKIVEHKSRCAHAIKDAKLDLKTLKKEDFDIQIADYFDVIAGT